MKAWMSSKFGQIQPWTTELAALERLKNRCYHFFLIDFHSIFLILAGNEDMHESLEVFEIQPDPTMDCRVSSP